MAHLIETYTEVAGIETMVIHGLALYEIAASFRLGVAAKPVWLSRLPPLIQGFCKLWLEY